MHASTARTRLRSIVIVAMLLVLVGAGSAAAYWTAQAQLGTRASAARVGIDQALLLTDGASPLSGTYDAETLTLAGAVTIENTGSRSASYNLDVRPGSSTVAGMPAALQVAAAPVEKATDCTPQAALHGATSAILGQGFAVGGTLATGATATVCVQTTLPAADLAGLTGAQLEVLMTSSLEYADGAQWQITADHALTVTQAVEAAPPVEVEEMKCLQDGPWEVQLGFTAEEGWQRQDAVEYRMFIALASSPESRMPMRYPNTTGWYPVVHLSNTAADVTALAGSAPGGYGNAWLYVEKKFDGETEWVPAAQSKFRLAPHESSPLGIYCGWQE